MKTIFKIFTILTVIALLAGGIYLLIENTSIANNIGGHGERHEFAEGERPEMPEGGFSERGERSEGNHHHNEVSFTRGLAEMGKAIAKISIITLFVLGIQFIFNRLNRFKKPKASA